MELMDYQVSFIEELYHKMFKQLYIYARRQLDSPSTSEEAVQETFMIACAKVDTLMNSPNPEGWLVNTLKNVIRNIKQNKSYISKHLMSQDIIDTLMKQGREDDPNPEFLYDGLVSKEDLSILKQVAIDNRSMLEVSEELGITLEACKKRVQRAKAKFRKKYFLD